MRIVRLELPDSGDAFIDGYNVLSHPDEVRRRIGFMPDAFPIDPTRPRHVGSGEHTGCGDKPLKK